MPRVLDNRIAPSVRDLESVAVVIASGTGDPENELRHGRVKERRWFEAGGDSGAVEGSGAGV